MMMFDLPNGLAWFLFVLALFVNILFWERRVKRIEEKIELLTIAYKALVCLPVPLEPGEQKTFCVTIQREKAS